jgi:hypothetical protein
MKESKQFDPKVFLLISLFMFSIFGSSLSATSATAPQAAYPTQDINVDALGDSLGQMFGMFREFGASGETFGLVLQMMFENFVNMSATQEIPGVYVINGSIIQESESDTYQYSEDYQWEYNPWGVYNMDNATDPADQDEYPYFILNQSGVLNYTRIEGVQLTFIIWDQDGSFIDALDNVINTVKAFVAIEEQLALNPDSTAAQAEAQAEAIEAAIEAVTYFLIHINDIITGDEVIIFNTIAFTNYMADFAGTVDGQWYVTQNGVRTNSRTLDVAYPAWEAEYRDLAEAYGDEYMLYILDEGYNQTRMQNYTAFSFDIIEIWLKEFQISIDVGKILAGLTPEDVFTDIFQELKLEFYIFTHHFTSWVLFDDSKFGGTDPATDNSVPDVKWEVIGQYGGENVSKITDTEIVDYIQFRGADFSFTDPVYDGDTMSWGVRADNLAFRVLPIGMNDDEVNETVAPLEHMEYFELGFTFEPSKKLDVETGDYFNAQGQKTMGSAKVKLLQSFGSWDLDTDDKPFTPHLKVEELQLATIYMSTIFHFKLWIENKEIASEGEVPDQALLDASNYNEETSKIHVGDIDQELPLAEIDIAGPDYDQTNAVGATTNHPAKTTIIPTVYAEWEAQNSETYVQNDTSTGQINSTINIDFSVLIYAVVYDTFGYNGFTSGDEIVHDPTFSIFIITSNPGLIAVILVVGSVTLVGVAAVLITKRKESALGSL